jgi:hypothetical protein
VLHALVVTTILARGNPAAPLAQQVVTITVKDKQARGPADVPVLGTMCLQQDRAAKRQHLLGNMFPLPAALIRTNAAMGTIQQERQLDAHAWPFMDGATVIGMLAGVIRLDATTVAPMHTATTIAIGSGAGTDAHIKICISERLSAFTLNASQLTNIFISHFVPLISLSTHFSSLAREVKNWSSTPHLVP